MLTGNLQTFPNPAIKVLYFSKDLIFCSFIKADFFYFSKSVCVSGYAFSTELKS